MKILDNTYLSADQYIEYSCEVADKIMQMKYGKSYIRYVKNIDKNISYTDEGQNIFNEILVNARDQIVRLQGQEGPNIIQVSQIKINFNTILRIFLLELVFFINCI